MVTKKTDYPEKQHGASKSLLTKVKKRLNLIMNSIQQKVHSEDGYSKNESTAGPAGPTPGPFFFVVTSALSSLPVSVPLS